MAQQWRGAINGTAHGELIVNFDEGLMFGRAQISYGDVGYSAIVIPGPLTSTGQLQGDLEHFLYAEASRRVPLPNRAHYIGEAAPPGTTGTWTTSLGGSGTFEIRTADIPAPRAPESVVDWRVFRENSFAEAAKTPKRWIYRGHRTCKQPLLTSFHREGRRDLIRYADEDVHELHRYLEATLRRSYNYRSDPAEYGALLHLAQHHGFPTPLLDWTASPFVAAYFAFHAVPRRSGQSDDVRIFAFNRQQWPRENNLSILDAAPRFTYRTFGGRDNARSLPQQAVTMFSNVVDIESLIADREEKTKLQFLRRIDLPADQRSEAMRELAVMGITHATLFPGIDGVCKALTEERF